MTKTFIGASIIALLISTPASAQLIGGGGGLGVGGLGGMGGTMGSVGGSIGRTGGDISSSASAPRRLPRPDRQARLPKPDAKVDGTASAANGRAAAGLTGSVDTATRQTNAAGNVVLSRPRPGTLAAPAVAVPTVAAPVVAVPTIAAGDVSLGYLGGADVAIVGRRQLLIDDGVTYIPRSQVSTYIDTQVDVLQRDLAGTGVLVERRGKQIFIELPSDVNFAFDKYDIQPRFYSVLNTVARTLNHYPATYVDVIGHTDAVGSDDYNQLLSERRAYSVAKYLMHSDANPDRLYVAGEGEFAPVASNASIFGRAANRRVEIILTPHEGPA